MSPLVSVVMSVYNGEKHLRESVKSILNQTFRDFEFIIINDGSTDKTKDILDEYASKDDRIVIIHQDNIGLTKSLNKGISIAKGNYIARQDVDDVSKPERFEKQVAFMENHHHVGMVSSNFEFIDGQGNVIRVSNLPTDKSVLKERLIEINQFCHGAAMIRKETLDTVGAYREFFRFAQDYDLWLRIDEFFDVINLPDVLFSYRMLDEAISCKSILLQSRFAGVASNLALQRRKEGKDDLSIGIEPELPPVSRLSESLQKKISEFYVRSPNQLIVDLTKDPMNDDLRYLLGKMCQENEKNRLSQLEELRSENQLLATESARKDDQLIAIENSISWKITGPLRALYDWVIVRRKSHKL